MGSTSNCRRFRVTGRVQGVFFRDSAREVAQNLRLTGYARNKSDGSVEILACGAPEALEKLGEWLWHGSPRARVDNVEWSAADTTIPPSFTTG
jgi:acylphosphatase